MCAYICARDCIEHRPSLLVVLIGESSKSVCFRATGTKKRMLDLRRKRSLTLKYIQHVRVYKIINCSDLGSRVASPCTMAEDERPRKRARFKHDSPSLLDICKKRRELVELKKERKKAFDTADRYIVVMIHPIWERADKCGSDILVLDKRREEALIEASSQMDLVFVLTL